MYSYKELKEKDKNNADRLVFIDFMLRFTGSIKRADITELFNLSDAAASKMLAAYNELRPNNMAYNHSLRVNTIEQNYKPLIKWRADIAMGMLANGFNKNKISDTDTAILPYERINTLPHQMNINHVERITRAINCGYAIQCKYYSKNSNNHSNRTIVPLNILHDGEHWIFRAYDRSEKDTSRNKFKFFNFARMLEVNEDVCIEERNRKPYEDLAYDPDWNIDIPLSLIIHEDRKEKRERDAIRIDFGIEDGSDELLILKKPAYLWILKNKWHIDTRPLQDVNNDHCSQTNKKYYRFRVDNLSMVNKLLEQHKCFSTFN
ncbi:WYL domain-containing protein [Aliivibrio sp. S10_S31]|uniref:WYL domain-containing protein n=1 Tax=Aliivibrio sp. S10_S31 TaxID=2720224 RepID=UPI00168173E8|nr:WYL domain-containing protein [Aliivibrio sp. S10_S31]MBD1570008.1 WYL domain-containing protein [Aliivibrio sp. S10_S31]